MSTCKDCIHYDLCADFNLTIRACYKRSMQIVEDDGKFERCGFFKNRSKFVDVSELQLNIIMKRQIAQKPIPEGQDEQDYILCPCCKNIVGAVDDYFCENKSNKFCHNCGQALDWGDSELQEVKRNENRQ